MKRFFGIFLFLCLLLSITAGVIVVKVYDMYEGQGPLLEDKTVSIPKGSSLISIANLLENEGVIYNRHVFRLGAKLTETSTNLRAGIYDFPAGLSSRETLAYLIDGGRELNFKVVIPEGVTIAQIFNQINNDDRLVGELPPVGSVVPGAVIEINGVAEEQKKLANKDPEDIFIMPDEGDLLPETYFFSKGDSKISVIKRMQAAMTKQLDELWKNRDEDLPVTNKRDALILASLVERETFVHDEKVLVASVFINRLNKRMRLQTDPTVIYALSNRWGRIERPLAMNDYKLDDPYNTYRIDGLPPGAICNPGVDAINAVLHPASTDYLFFVANGTGRHQFAQTFAEHKQNRQKWLKIIHKRRQALNDSKS
ncbi:MAG: endolytic transglycosylase MltG [Alphaproteobacteria bacterium]|nr:endolytic transglycosylase MltG [Alphaproteobacteria bacterium]